ncbi:MAG: phospho-N-acetylmuramoyl-pentapeptide-transferase [Clostridia bacterium]|nr:phospho-N-acetylmuramoyl-pentapeptide-transferase [Clostridia bacterium]
MNEFTITFAVATVAIFLLTVVAERVLIPILRSHKLGQKILDIGPRWHKSKEGTPTMGGIGFILAAMVVMAVFFIIHAVKGDSADYIPLSLTLAFAVGNGAIGFVDDYCKLVKKQNEGLTWLQKLILQLVISSAYVCVMSYTGYMSTALNLPFTDYTIDFGWMWYPIAVLVLTGVVNGGNITDGIDGLAASVSCVIGGFFAILAFAWADDSLSMVAAILIGASLGFLVYNFHPARVFMGDTGSLFLGALVIAAAFQIEEGAVGLIISMVFILEMLSSLLQVVYFKLTHGKRLFKMAPLHHHFEKCGWSENRIVAVFSLVEALFCVAAWFAI